MKLAERPLLVDVLLQPERLTGLGGRELDLLLRQARVARLIARLQVVLQDAGLIDRLPVEFRHHLDAAGRALAHQHRALNHELDRFVQLFGPMGIEPVLLKGAAYVAAGLDAGRGRTFSDIDILVPAGRIADVESRLMLDGWACTMRDEYDQRYYRTWMHEIPPLTHMKRGTSLDVHHAITPLTARIRADSGAMLAIARPLASRPGLRTLCPTDRFLHSAAHLFLDGDFDAGLRDMFDLRSLLQEGQAGDPAFSTALGRRAGEVGLELPLGYALHYLEHLLDVRNLDEVRSAMTRPVPRGVRLAWMDSLFSRVLLPHHPSCADALTPAAKQALYVRGHWLRMPLHLLLAHLTRKALRREDETPDNPG
jgi:hypothetical protein